MSYLYCTDLNGSECLGNLLGTFNFVQYKCSSFYGDYVQSLVIAYLSICKDIQTRVLLFKDTKLAMPNYLFLKSF